MTTLAFLHPIPAKCSLVILFVFATLNLSRADQSPADSNDSFPSTTVFELQNEGENQQGFRIPALAVSRQGTLLAFCERRVGLHDHGENDIVLRRSTDGGATWLPIQTVVEAGRDSLNDPCVVVLSSGRILLRYTRFPHGVHARQSRRSEIAEPGYGGPKNVRLFLMHSDDDGQSWSQPRDVTRQLRRETAISIGSPGVGLELTSGKHRGRILLPNYEVYSLGGGRRSKANSVSYSDDGGQSWKLSELVPEPNLEGYGDEAQLVTLSNGDLLMSSRDEQGSNYRKLAKSSDGGETWSSHRLATDLLTPPCMASLIRYTWQDDKRPGVLLHTLPHTEDSRSNGTIMVSTDDGASWTPSLVIEPEGFAYSCLAQLPGGEVGCLYETEEYHRIVFLRIPVEAILD